MDNLDGKKLNDIERFKKWTCPNGHVMGVMERTRTRVMAGGKSLRFYGTRLLIFHDALDMTAETPAEIEVATALDGRVSSVVHRCSVCNALREWHPSPEVAAALAGMYVAE